ncbi:MAG: F0F1 ATP synthase subunit A [Saprospiraceae bacterium]
MIALRKFYIVLVFSALSLAAFGQNNHTDHDHTGGSHAEPATEAAHSDESHADAGHADAAEAAHGEGESHGCGHPAEENPEFNASETALHHIADANAIHIVGDVYLHLPCILYAPSAGWTFTTTSAFHPHHHGNGTMAVDGYVLVHGNVMRVKDENFPKGEVAVTGPTHEEREVNGKPKMIYFVQANGNCYELDAKTSYDGGMLGGGITSFSDFSITRNVFTMLLTVLLLFFVFRAVAKSYKTRDGMAPKGLQNFFEPLVTFIRDDVAKPNIPKRYDEFMPFLLSVFFFILGLNLIGQIPFFPGSANVTGNLSITLVLAVITFIITNLKGNKHYWEHIFWMPGVPTVLKVLIITPIEILGLFLKPFTLMLRLFANVTAGHIVIISFVSLIFIFGDAGESMSGTAIGAAASIPLTLFMMALELLVAFLQAYIFTMLSAVYFGMATEEAHH